MRATPSRAAGGIALVLALPLAAFVLGRPKALPPADLTLVLPAENATFDPQLCASVADQWVARELFECLTCLDPVTLEPIPAAAGSWTISADGRVTTFRLRAGLRWSDGRRLVAGAFVDGFRRLLDPRTGCQSADLFRVIAGADSALAGGPIEAIGVRAPDDATVVIETAERCPYLPALVSHCPSAPIRLDVIERFGDRWTEPEHLVCNGPYRLALRRVRDRVRLVANEQWHGAAGVGARVVDGLVVESSATALNLYLTGAVDWINAMPASAVPALRAQGRDDLKLSVILATNFLRMNVTHGPLADVRVRRAIDAMLDRAALCEFVYRKGDRPARSFVPPNLPGYRPPERTHDEDVAEARRLLAEAGFPGGRGLPELELLHAADESAAGVAEAIVARAKETLGLRLRPAPQEYRVFIDSQRQLRYDLCLTAWVGDFPDPTNFLDVFRSDSGSNRCGWKDAAYDALLDAARAAPDAAERERRLAAAETYLLERGPIAPISVRGQPNLVAPSIAGFTTNLLDLHPIERMRRVTP